MTLKKIKNNGSDKKTLLIIGMGALAFSLLAKIVFKDYYVYGICPVWIFFLLVGGLLFISGIASLIKYNKSYKAYSDDYKKTVDNELNDNFKNLYGVYFTKSFVICTTDEFIILEYKNIKKAVLHLISNKNCVSVQTNDEKIIKILESSMEGCSEVMDYLISNNKNIKKCYDNINNEAK